MTDVVYRGMIEDRDSSRWYVIVEEEGKAVRKLPHHVKHSPTGMSWGYGGSGPADLSRSLLIDALAIKTHVAGMDCCIGRAGDAVDERLFALVKGGYQGFKWAFVSKWPQGGPWTMRRSEIRTWVAAGA